MCWVTYCVNLCFRSSDRPSDDWLDRQSPAFGMKGHWLKRDGCYTSRYDAGSWLAQWVCDNPQPDLSHEHMFIHLTWSGDALVDAWEKVCAAQVETAGSGPAPPLCLVCGHALTVSSADPAAERVRYDERHSRGCGFRQQNHYPKAET